MLRKINIMGYLINCRLCEAWKNKKGFRFILNPFLFLDSLAAPLIPDPRPNPSILRCCSIPILAKFVACERHFARCFRSRNHACVRHSHSGHLCCIHLRHSSCSGCSCSHSLAHTTYYSVAISPTQEGRKNKKSQPARDWLFIDVLFGFRFLVSVELPRFGFLFSQVHRPREKATVVISS